MLNLKFNEGQFNLRLPAEHAEHIRLLKNSTVPDHYSMTFGINRDSILNSLKYFNVVDETIPPDLMHNLLEGYLPYATKLLLTQLFM